MKSVTFTNHFLNHFKAPHLSRIKVYREVGDILHLGQKVYFTLYLCASSLREISVFSGQK